MTPTATLDAHRPVHPHPAPHGHDDDHDPALDEVTLTVEPGEFAHIVGRQRDGEPARLRLRVGLDTTSEGELLFDGHRIAATSLRCGIVFQAHRLFLWMTVAQNVTLGLLDAGLDDSETARRVRKYLDLVGLTGLEAAYPHQLSGDTAQRVALARALVSQPQVLLLDDPFGALDAHTRDQLQLDLHRIWQAEDITMIHLTRAHGVTGSPSDAFRGATLAWVRTDAPH